MYELNHTNSEMKPTIDNKDWPKTFKLIEQYFTLKHGKLHIPIAYVIREQVTLPPTADNPTGNYAMPVAEMIVCAPHERKGFCSAERWSWCLSSSFQPLPWSKQCEQPVRCLREGSRHDLLQRGGMSLEFEKYVMAQKKHHQILEGLVCYGYLGIDARTKVRYLMDGSKTSAFDVRTGQILGNPVLCSDFDGLVMLYKDFITQFKSSSSSAPTHKISAAGVTKGTIEDRYYVPADYTMLSNEQKEQLHQLQGKRGHKPGAKDSKVLPSHVNKKQKTDGKCTIAALLKANAAMQKRLDSMEKKLAANDGNIPETILTDGSSTQGSNSNNAALTCQN
jgi:hypothetical protein